MYNGILFHHKYSTMEEREFEKGSQEDILMNKKKCTKATK